MTSDSRVILPENTKKIFHHRNGKRIVFTNGCFDIVHIGHLRYLEAAKKLGDILIVAVNSDDSVKRLKGDKRPINKLSERMELLANIRHIDYVTYFEEDTPYNLISNILPDVLVKGGDWKVEEIVGSDIVIQNGGIVKSLNFEDGFATTNIIQEIINRYCVK